MIKTITNKLNLSPTCITRFLTFLTLCLINVNILATFHPFFNVTELMIYFDLMTSTHLVAHDISGIFAVAYPAHK